ncbi:CDP-glycerol glycerophosphotransferase family protein [Psychrobacillus sp. NEAU-3TGS]|uniref:CDP-glycerol glycerophosphotransferase family protein n=1 Tax=Psychrobacillus sp. NEAU-3TGS TaxID=2995412 RepID=UPI0024963629|nr:CDP-glycerol glycerophosphotransferase family protein [Psychrobacillus sp. NEAU-3TGS]MDI2588280.1 CDP-glycerol glycerophosphotransferase family protein [Psychrobacillus sp. NEAU-3TGS]
MELKTKGTFDPLIVFVKVLGAFLLSKLSFGKQTKSIVLVGGNLGEKYEDNASVFHRYLIEHHREEMDIYWMYDPKTTYIKEQRIPNAVALGSFRNYLLFFKANYSIHGHSIAYDIAPSIDKYIFLNKKTIMIHISHGIECFKKILIQKEDVPLLARCNFFNCASQYEKNIKLHEWGIPEEKLIVTGMARFDRFGPNRPSKKVKHILVMFTWRETLFDLSEEEFLASNYFQSTLKIFQDKRMEALISFGQLHLKVMLHPFMKKFEHLFRNIDISGGEVKFYSFDEISIGDEIIEADMLLTDYSSISWDFLYMNKPIIFFTFDQEEFLKMRGSYLDLDKDLYGYKANTIDEVIEFMSHITERNHTENPFYTIASNYIDYFDRNNCKRLAVEIFRKR